MKKSQIGFTLVETVIALGIFAFAIIILIGIFPVGMRSTRDVANESHSINVSQTIFGIWKQARLGDTVVIPGFITNLPVSLGNRELYFNDAGVQTTQQEAVFRIDYNVTSDPLYNNLYRVDLICHWPANAPDEVAQKRVFTGSFSK
jgi:uncharacterized protein (TIGR02598 family)